MGNEGDSKSAADGQHPSVARLQARAAVTRSREYPKWPSSITAGVIPMTLEGRFRGERERLGPEFTEQQRQWRIQWHKDQILDHHEPRHVPELAASTKNIFRRIYMTPLNHVEHKFLVPLFGAEGGNTARWAISRLIMGYGIALYAWYTLKYNHNDWEKWNGWQVWYERPPVLPGDKAYPMPNPRPNAQDFYDNGFKSRTVFRN